MGYPGENTEDRKLTLKMIKKLVLNGLDEVAIFIITPIPGSKIFNELKGYKSLSELNFSPKWRSDYKNLNKFRLKCYFIFFIYKLISNPLKIFQQVINFFKTRFDTKMEMVPFKAIKLIFYELKSK